MDFVELRPGVWQGTVGAERVNVTLIRGASHCLLVDTGASREEGEEIRRASVELTGSMPTVVLTHAHWDHVLGLGAFAGVEIIAHENFAQGLACEENRRHAAAHGIDLATLPSPTTLLTLIAARDLGEMTVEIAHFGPSHTTGDLLIAVPSAGVIVTGDLVEVAGPPQFDETSSVDGWVRSLDSLYAILKDTTVLIPGHGPICSPGEVGRMRAGLAAILDQTTWARSRGVPVNDVYGYDNLEWPWDEATARRGISVAYQESH